MIIIGKTDIGKVRTDNQDSFLFDTKNDRIGFAVVCDGMGGANGGKYASTTAVKVFSENLSKLDESLTYSDMKSILNKAITLANRKIYNDASNVASLSGMGTTLVSAVVIGYKAYFVNVGDSRAYIVRDGKIRQITCDHSLVQELIDKGELKPSKARTHPNKNIITRAVGASSIVETDLFCEDIKDGDIIFLCSDGIINHLEDSEILFEFEKNIHTFESLPEKLINLANEKGGSDNSTVVIIKI